ncbi:MAG: carboxypeptidase-like regulatory domain-containing protein [Gemmatimonadaceae bacterium]
MTSIILFWTALAVFGSYALFLAWRPGVRRAKMGRVIGASALAVTLLAGCEGLGIASPEGEFTLRVNGFVRDVASGAPIPGARVAVARWEAPWGYTELASVHTDAAGFYSLTYRLRHVVTDEELAGYCSVWYRDITTDVEIQAEAAGYRTWESGGFDAVPALRCTNEQQVIEIRMHK